MTASGEDPLTLQTRRALEKVRIVLAERGATLPVDGMNESAREMWIEYLLGDPGLIAEGACTGLYSVILDGSARARCVIRTGSVTVAPLGQVTAAFARREGEGDGSRAYWLDGHRRYFAAEHQHLGLPFSDEIPVVYEEFDLVWPQP